MTFRRFRILLLLGVLAAAISLTWLEQYMVRGWQSALDVQIIPINGDGSAAADAAIAALDAADFADINDFLVRETARYGVALSPAASFTVKPALATPPPAPPTDGNVLKIMAWSLQLRWWVWRQADSWLPALGTVKLFLLYHAPQDDAPLAHSLGLQKGLIGVVHVFADPGQSRQNHIVIAHELLHTLGASDKYDADGRPVYPHGYADPHLPQHALRREAEIMAGRLLAPSGRAVMPASLERCVIGAQTAREINLDAAFARRYQSAAR
jgi:hypothetical protein